MRDEYFCAVAFRVMIVGEGGDSRSISNARRGEKSSDPRPRSVGLGGTGRDLVLVIAAVLVQWGLQMICLLHKEVAVGAEVEKLVEDDALEIVDEYEDVGVNSDLELLLRSPGAEARFLIEMALAVELPMANAATAAAATREVDTSPDGGVVRSSEVSTRVSCRLSSGEILRPPSEPADEPVKGRES